MCNGKSVEWFRTEMDGPGDFEIFVTAMKTSHNKFGINIVQAKLTSEGKVFPVKTTKYPYEEAKHLDEEKKHWIVRHKETNEWRVAKYEKVKELTFLNTYSWWKMRQFSNHNMLNGVEAFYDPKEKLFITIMEFCYCKFKPL